MKNQLPLVNGLPDNLPDLTEQHVETEAVVQGKFITLHTDRIRLPDGTFAHREYVRHPGAVVIAAFIDDDTLVFEHQYRYAMGRHFIELPAGKIDDGEAPLATAKRELQEETGYISDEWQFAVTLNPTIGYANEHIDLYIAKKVAFVGHRRDIGEFLEVFTLSMDDAVARIGRGEITDTKTAFSILWLDKFYRR